MVSMRISVLVFARRWQPGSVLNGSLKHQGIEKYFLRKSCVLGILNKVSPDLALTCLWLTPAFL